MTRATPPRDADATRPAASLELVIVAIGASAGGLEALKQFLGGLITPLPVAYIICQHLPRHRESLLAELLGRATKLKVRFATDGTVPAANTVYVVPPQFDAEFDGHSITLHRPKADTAPHPSVDRLFNSLAANHGERTVGIILSGTGSDGAVGLRAIADAGGVGLAQDPSSAQYDGMPQAAIDYDGAMAVRPPERLGGILQDLCALPGVLEHPLPQDSLDEGALHRFAAPIRDASRIDIGNYKRATIMRRIFRRMNMLNVLSVDDYATRVNGDPEEAGALADELRVGVTSFFRDPDAFEAAREHLSGIIDQLSHQDTLRVWVPGCSTGQEAFTFALIIADIMSARVDPPGWKIFATDIGRDAVNTARMGVYPLEEYERIPSSLRQRYLTLQDDRMVVQRAIRQHMIFAVHDLLADPPFSKLHMVSCRNLLIYLRPPAQRQALASFHHALLPGGTLMLGSAETPDSFRELFDTIDSRARLFERTAHPSSFKPPRGPGPTANATRPAPPAALRPSNTSPESRTRDLLSSVYAPPSLIIDETDRIVHFIGELSPFINLPRGPADWLVSELVREPMAIEIRSLIHRCRRKGDTSGQSRGDKYTMDIHGESVQVVPVARLVDDQEPSLLALSFETLPAAIPTSGHAPSDANAAVQDMERELRNTREHLQSVIEEVETTNEELQTLNEELQSANEELLSTNEELQTSNEELQSANEELVTVNHELADKGAELEISRTDLWNIKESLDFALVVVNHSQMITQFNEAVFTIADSKSIQPGAPLVGMNWRIPITGLSDQIQRVIQSAEPETRELAVDDHCHYEINVLPYRSGSARPLGAIVAIKDVSQERASRTLLSQREALYRVILESSGTGMCLIDSDLTVLESNAALADLLNVRPDALTGSTFALNLGADGQAALNDALSRLRAGQDSHARFEARIADHHGDPLWVEITAAPVLGDTPPTPGQFVLHVHDVSQHHQRRQRLLDEHTQLSVLHNLMRHIVETADASAAWPLLLDQLPAIYPELGIAIYERDGNTGFKVLHTTLPTGCPPIKTAPLELAVAGDYLSRLKRDGIVAVNSIDDGELPAALAESWRSLGIRSWLDAGISLGDELPAVVRIMSADERSWAAFDRELLRGIADTISIALRDRQAVSARERALADLRRQSARLATTLDLVEDAIITTDQDGRLEHLNAAAEALTGATLDSVKGRAIFNLLKFHKNKSPLPGPIEQALRENATVVDESGAALLESASGETTAVSYRAAPIHDQTGATVGGVVTLRPVKTPASDARKA